LIDFITDILWLTAALAVLASVIIAVLNPLYAFWTENKYHMDLEGELYQSVSEAVEKATEEGLQISVQFTIGEPEVEETEEAPAE